MKRQYISRIIIAIVFAIWMTLVSKIPTEDRQLSFSVNTENLSSTLKFDQDFTIYNSKYSTLINY